jgi:transposase InsO family protein
LKWFSLGDECLTLEAGGGMPAKALRAMLARVVQKRGAPAHVWSDNGSEFIAKAMRSWMAAAAWRPCTLSRGPCENGNAESLSSKVRDEPLNADDFGSVTEGKMLGKEWRWGYDHVRELTARWGIGRLRSTGRWLLGPAPLSCAGPRNCW